MGRLAHTALIGFFLAVVAGIIFVQAGRQTGVSGGAQSSQIINAGASGISNVAKGLEGG
jgi:hypothetical protein